MSAHFANCISANPLSNISPRKMTASGCVLFAMRHALRKFMSTKMREMVVRNDIRPGYDLSLRICGSATRRTRVCSPVPC